MIAACNGYLWYIYLVVCAQVPGRPGKEPKESSGRRGRRSNGDGQGGKARRKRNDAAKVSHLICFHHVLHYTRGKNVVSYVVNAFMLTWCGKVNSIWLVLWLVWFSPCRPWCWMQMEPACPPAQNHISVSTVMLPSAAPTTCADMCSYTQVRDIRCSSVLYFSPRLSIFLEFIYLKWNMF